MRDQNEKLLEATTRFLFFLTLSCMFSALFFPTSVFDYYTRSDGTKRRRNRLTNIHQSYTPIGWKDDVDFANWQNEQAEPVRQLFSAIDIVSPNKQWSPMILNNASDWDFKVEGSATRVEYFSTNPDTKKKECLFSGQETLQPEHIYPQQRASFTRPAELPSTVYALPHKTDFEVDVTVFVPTATNSRTHETVYFNPPASRTIQMTLTRE